MNKIKDSTRATENHQGFKNLDTFKFAINIDNNYFIYKNKISLFKTLFRSNSKIVKEKIKIFLQNQKDFIKQQEQDFYISLVDFNDLIEYYYNDFLELKHDKLVEALQENQLTFINVKRYFDKLNGNSYFVYSIEFDGLNDFTILTNEIHYGYNSSPFYEAKDKLKSILGNFFNKLSIKETDLGYKNTQRELKDFIGL